MKNQFWFGQLGSTEKKMGANYEQLLSAFFSCFWGKHYSVLTNKLHNKSFFFICFKFFLEYNCFFLDCAHSQMRMYHIKISYCRTRHLDLKKLCVFQLSGQIDPCLAGLKFLWVKLKYATFEGDSFMFSWTKKMKIRVSVHGTWERSQ